MASEIKHASKGTGGFRHVDFHGSLPLLVTGERWLDEPLLSYLSDLKDLGDIALNIVRVEQDPCLAAISAAEVTRYDWFNHHSPHLENDDFPEAMQRVSYWGEREL